MTMRQRLAPLPAKPGRPRAIPDRRAPRGPVPGPAAPSAAARPGLADERRLRSEGGPEDLAVYECGCGCVFEARVSTDVACPHCAASQAW
jgi:hypothetical protein